MQRLIGKLTYSNIVSSICLVLVLGGGSALAATKLAKNSVGTKQLQKESVNTAKIKVGAVNGAKVEDNSLTGADVDASSLGIVPSADFARTAGSAGSAQTAQSAKTADSATTAQSADTAKSAQSAVTAERATTATAATSAQTAASAVSAQTAQSAETAGKATLAESLAGRTSFSLFTEGERQLGGTFPFTVTLRCSFDGEKRTAAIVVETESGGTLLVSGRPSQEIFGFVPIEVLTTTGENGASASKAGGDVTMVSSNEAGTAYLISSPTVGADLTGHSGQCFFSGVVEELKVLPVQ